MRNAQSANDLRILGILVGIVALCTWECIGNVAGLQQCRQEYQCDDFQLTCLLLFEGSHEHQKWACETIRIPLNIRGITNVKWKPLSQERRQLTRSAIYTKVKLWGDGKHFGMSCEFSTTVTSVIHKKRSKVLDKHRSTKIMTEDATGFFSFKGCTTLNKLLNWASWLSSLDYSVRGQICSILNFK